MLDNPRRIRPTGSRLLVTRYQLPETIVSGKRADGSEYRIVTPEAWRQDRTLSVWEIERVGREASEAFLAGGGAFRVHDSHEGEVVPRLRQGDIVETADAWAQVPLQDLVQLAPEVEPHYFILGESVSVCHKY